MNWHEKTEDYYHNRLSIEESKLFEDALEKDESLRKELEEMAQRERDEYVKGVMRHLFEQDEQKRLRKCKIRVLLIGLALSIALIFFGYSLF